MSTSTYEYVKELRKSHRPRVLVVSVGEFGTTTLWQGRIVARTEDGEYFRVRGWFVSRWVRASETRAIE